MRHTIKKRMRAKLQEVKETLRQQMHRPLPEQDVRLRNVVRGYYAYHAVPPNASALEAFRTQVTRYWLRTLRHRSQKSRVTWERMNQIATRWLPRPKILHPWPEQRFDARTQGKSPVRQCRTPGSVRGAPGNRSPYRDRIIPQSTKTALYSTHLAFLVRAQLFKHVEGTALFKQPVARETALRNTGRVKRRLWFF
jgi:hypothetical protein